MIFGNGVGNVLRRALPDAGDSRHLRCRSRSSPELHALVGSAAGSSWPSPKRGFDVALTDIAHDDEAAQRVAEVEKSGRRALFLRSDVSRRDENERVVAETVERLGRPRRVRRQCRRRALATAYRRSHGMIGISSWA